MSDEPRRCAAHVLADNVLAGCGDEAISTTPARGTHRYAGVPVDVALCDEHLALVEQGAAIVMTVTFKP